ncbi:MAG TPA: signal peptidase I [Candidatus Saccharimonadales bacterium]|nr:signal peptidase I [Candidatus Saccharimonadales bacterium]
MEQNKPEDSAGESSNYDRHPQFNLAPAGPSRWQDFYGILAAIFTFIVIPVVIALFLTAFVIQSYQVDGYSMEKTLDNHDRLIVDKLPRSWARITGHPYVPARGNIIVFNQTGLSDTIYQKQLIKRVIGLPGERVKIAGGTVTIFNKSHPKGFDPDTSGLYTINAEVTTGNEDVTLSSNEIFVMGDNRGNSEDSRYFGPVKLNNVVGELILRILPIDHVKAF